MSTTGLLGSIDSRPDNIILGGGIPITPSIFDRTLTSAITLTDAARSGLITRSVTSATSITDAATKLTNHLRSASTALALVSSGTGGQKLNKSASSALALTSVSTQHQTRYAASSAIALTDSATGRGTLYLSASNALALTDLGHSGLTFTEALTSQITASNLASHTGTIRVSATSPLSLLSLADHRIKIRFAETVLTMNVTAERNRVYTAASAITLTQLAEQGVRHLSASNTLVLNHIARPNPRTFGPGGRPTYDYDLDGNQIVLNQTARSSIKMLVATSQIALDEAVRCLHPTRLSASNSLTTTEQVYNPDTISFDTVDTGLRDAADFHAKRTQTPHTIISFATQANVSNVRAAGIAKSATSALSLVSDGRLSKTGAATSTLTSTNTATVIRSNAQIGNELELGDLAAVKIRRGVVNETPIALNQSVAFVLVQNNTLCNYSPFIGSTTDPNAPTPPPATLPTRAGLPVGVQFRLEYPATGPVTDTLDMRAPDLGNRDRLAFNRINRETRGGTLVIYADPMWPKIQTLSLTFSGLKQQVARDLLTFIQAHLGGRIKLTDWEGRQWTGVIMTPDEAVVQDSRDRFTANFEFEGVPA